VTNYTSSVSKHKENIPPLNNTRRISKNTQWKSLTPLRTSTKIFSRRRQHHHDHHHHHQAMPENRDYFYTQTHKTTVSLQVQYNEQIFKNNIISFGWCRVVY